MKTFLLTAAVAATLSPAAQSAVLQADTVIEYHFVTGSYDPGFAHGGPPNDTTVPVTHAVDADLSTFVSLRTGEYIVIGFSTGYVFDGPGDDLFIDETGDASEEAQLFVSSDWGATFSFLDVINGNTTNSLDLAAFGYSGTVNALKIVGLDNRGGSPGFDLTAAWGLEGSTTEVPAVPLPATLPLMLGGAALAGLVGACRKPRRNA